MRDLEQRLVEVQEELAQLLADIRVAADEEGEDAAGGHIETAATLLLEHTAWDTLHDFAVTFDEREEGEGF